MNAGRTTVIQLKNIGKSFRDPRTKRRVRVLGDINLDIYAGEILCVVGPSGCGKSTLLNGIGGFRPFTEGTALIEGKPIGPPSRDRGVVFQDYPVQEFLTALENVALGLNLDRLSFLSNLVPNIVRGARMLHLIEATEYLMQMGLEKHSHKYPRELSGGQRQRVAIAQALAMRPRILLMDEPFSGLDPRSRESLQLTILKIHAQLKNTILFVTHDLEEAIFLGTRVIVLLQNHDGRSESQGATIAHCQELDRYANSDAKKTGEFGNLVQELRAKFGHAHLSKNAEDEEGV